MTALRQRLIEDLQVRNYSPRTVEAYVAAVAKLAKHFGRSPDQLTNEELRAFQVALLAKKPSWSQLNQVVAGLRFFFGTTLARAGVVEMLPYGKKPKRLPTVLSVEEVTQLLAAARPGRERVLLQTAHACGLRITELLSLQVTDIDSARMVVNVRQGKGAKDRQVPLPGRRNG
jgi:integrase/recombinase XerD